MMRIAGLLAIVACSSNSRIPPVRFANRPPVTIVDDRRNVPVAPAERRYRRYGSHYEAVFYRPVSRALRLAPAGRALGVNALDEVPDSTWFTNRIGVRELGLDELRTGPARGDSPEAHKPWQIVRNKGAGESPGFVIRDARGVEFVLKFDARGYPELASGASAITSRLLWAIGYNVPEEHVVYADPRELVVTAESMFVDRTGKRRPLTRRDVERVLAESELDDSGRLRGVASRLLAGKPLGGHPSEGRRPDDPNDRIPHERRRDLRGAYPIFAWLDHADAKDANTLDMWIHDPRDPTRRYVKHYLIDFDKSLGVLAMTSPNRRVGHAYYVDLGDMLHSFATVGLGARPWDERTAPALCGVGLFESATFDPGAWKPMTPGYLPLVLADARDSFWGAKLVARFTPAQLRAVVETARYSDPRAVEYITATLIERQRATARYWFERTSPLDRFAVEDDALCFDDLMIAHGLLAVAPQAPRYTIARYDRDARPLASVFALRAMPHGRACFPLGLAPARDGYTIFEIATGARRHVIYVHVARDASGSPRVIGLWRA